MTEESPVQDAPKKAEVRPPPEKRTPSEWAKESGRVRRKPGGVVLSEPVPSSPFSGEHRAAEVKHRWRASPDFTLTRADYEAAIAAAKKLQKHGPAIPGQGV
jgi:hypothetical protein